MSDDFDSFIFTHIPKCGGTSFRKFINQNALHSGIQSGHIYIPGENGRSVMTNVSQLGRLGKFKFKRAHYKVIAMHAPFGFHSEYSNRIKHPFYYTILRDPVDRFLSHYYFFNYTLGRKGCKGKELDDLEDEFKKSLISRLSNMMIKHLANFQLNAKGIPVHSLKIAQRNLRENYSCFGLLNNLRQSMDVLKDYSPRWISWIKEYPTEKSHQIKFDYRKNVSKDTYAMIRQYNQLDIEFYHWANQLFDERYK